MTTRLADVIVPEIFTPATQLYTEEKSVLIQSGAMVRSSFLDTKLSGGGLTFNVPAYNDLANEDEDIANDDPTNKSTPSKITQTSEIAVRMVRHKSWGSMTLVSILESSDPMDAIAMKVAGYWQRRLQAAFIAVWKGVFANSSASHSGDLVHDASNGGTYEKDVTDFGAANYLAAKLTMGDAQEVLSLVMMNSITYHTAQLKNLIEFIPDSRGETKIATYLGARIILDDAVPFSNNVFRTWLFGPAACQFGVGQHKKPTAVSENEDAGNGSGEEILHSRVVWCLHPTGYKFVNSSVADGGPTNVQLQTAASWERGYPERKMIKAAELITTEFSAV